MKKNRNHPHSFDRAEFFGAEPDFGMRHRHDGPPGPGALRRGRGRGFGRGPRARRGDVRAALLVLLSEGPRNGYSLMQEIEERTDGVWRPSPGSVYPTLAQLEDEGLVKTLQTDGRKEFTITDAGQEAVDARGDAPTPWDEVTTDGGPIQGEVGHLIRQVASASSQVLKAGNQAQLEAAKELLTDTRKKLYKILAED